MKKVRRGISGIKYILLREESREEVQRCEEGEFTLLEPQIVSFSKVKLGVWLGSHCALCDLLASAGSKPWKVDTA